jgi:prepilin-type processing-associated H-X9-DG protein
LTPRERLRLFIPVCHAVQHAHQKGIIHRDLKPSNVMIALYDGQPVPKVIDFGVAKATSQKLTERTVFTEVGQRAWAYSYPPFDFNDPSVPPDLYNGTGYLKPQANAQIQTYLCSSDNAINGTGTNLWLTLNINQGIIDGQGYYLGPPSDHVYIDGVLDIPNYGHELGRSDYCGVGGAYGKIAPGDTSNAKWAPFTGIYYENSRTRLADITDGTSNTAAFGEWLGGVYKDGNRQFVLSWMGAGWWYTKFGLAPVYPDEYGNGSSDFQWRMFQSRHPGVVNFAFADGSVHSIGINSDYNTFIYLSGMADGQVFDPANAGY